MTPSRAVAVAVGAAVVTACTSSPDTGDGPGTEAGSPAADWRVVDDDCGGPELLDGGIEPLTPGADLAEALGRDVDLGTARWWVPFGDLREDATADTVEIRDVSSGLDRFLVASVGVTDPRLVAWDPAGEPLWAGDLDGWELLNSDGRFALLHRDETIMAVDQYDGGVAACYERSTAAAAPGDPSPPVAVTNSMLADGLDDGSGEPLRLTRLDVSTFDLGVGWTSEHEPGADVLHVGSELSTWVLPPVPDDPTEGTVWLRRLDDDTGDTAWEHRLGPAGSVPVVGESGGVDDPVLSVDDTLVWSDAISDRLFLGVEQLDGTQRLVVVSENGTWTTDPLTARPTAAVGALGVMISLDDGSAVGIDLTGSRRWQTPGAQPLGPDAPFLLSDEGDVAAQLMIEGSPPAFVDVESGEVRAWEPLAWIRPTAVTGAGDTLIGSQAAFLVEPEAGLVVVSLPSADELVAEGSTPAGAE